MRLCLCRTNLSYFRNTILAVLRRRFLLVLVIHIWWTSCGCRLENYIQACMMNADFQWAWTPPEPSRNNNGFGNVQFCAGWSFPMTQLVTVQDSVPGHPALNHSWKAVVGLKLGRKGVGRHSLKETTILVL